MSHVRRRIAVLFCIGGEGGIRTPDALASMPHFECGAFDHSATSPSTTPSRHFTARAAERQSDAARKAADECVVEPETVRDASAFYEPRPVHASPIVAPYSPSESQRSPEITELATDVRPRVFHPTPRTFDAPSLRISAPDSVFDDAQPFLMRAMPGYHGAAHLRSSMSLTALMDVPSPCSRLFGRSVQ